MTRKRLSTSPWSSTADGSSRMSRRVSCESARAMLTICCAAGGEAPDLAGGRDLAVPEAGEQVGGRAVRPAALAHPGRGQLVAQEDVLRDGEPRHQVELLVDRGDAELHRGLRRGQRDGLALPEDLALVGLVAGGEHLDQGRLAGAVLPQQAVDLAGTDVEVDAAEREHAGEALHDAAHLEERGRGRLGHHGGTVACVTHFCRAPAQSHSPDVESAGMCLTPPVRTGELFELLRDGRPWTRAQLADATGLARSTVTTRIDTLMRLGLVAPYGGARSTGGRPPTLFALNPGAKLVVGVDIGATHARAALTDLDGKILGETDARIEVAAGPRAGAGLGRGDRAGPGRGQRPPDRRPRGDRHRAARTRGALHRAPDQPADHAGLGPLRRARPPPPGLPRAGARRQRRQHHGARRAPRLPARRRRPRADQGRHRHRCRHRLRRGAAARRPRHRGRPRARPRTAGRRRAVPVRQHRLPRGRRRGPGTGRGLPRPGRGRRDGRRRGRPRPRRQPRRHGRRPPGGPRHR